MRVLRALLAIFFLPARLTLHILRSPASDKVFYYTISPLQFFRPKQAEHPEIKAVVPMQGGGFYSAGDTVMVDTNGDGGGAVIDYGDKSFATGMGSGSYNAGYMFHAGKRLRIYPLVGMGGIGQTLQQFKGENDLSTQTISVQRSGGVGIEYRIGGRFGFVVGARIGGVQSFFGGGTEPQIKLLLGLGRFGKKD